MVLADVSRSFTAITVLSCAMTDMIPDGPRVLRVWIVVVLVLPRCCEVGGPAVEWCAIVLTMNMDRNVRWAAVAEPNDRFYEDTQ